MKVPNYLKRILKVCFGFFLLWILFLKIPGKGVFESLLEARLSFFLLALVMYLGGQVLCAYKWSVLAEPLGFKRPFLNFVSFYFIGMFFNLFMPGSIGGDLYRAALLAGLEKSRKRAAYSVLAERYTGGIALLSFCALAVGIYFRSSLPPVLSTLIFTLLTIGWSFLLTLPVWERNFPWVQKLARKLNLEDFTIYWKHPTKLLWVLILSFIFQFINILTVVLLGMSIKINAPLLSYFFIVPIVDLLSILPISISGLGIREGGYVLMFKSLGVEASKGLACGLLVLTITLISGILGGIVYSLTSYPIVILRKKHEGN